MSMSDQRIESRVSSLVRELARHERRGDEGRADAVRLELARLGAGAQPQRSKSTKRSSSSSSSRSSSKED